MSKEKNLINFNNTTSLSGSKINFFNQPALANRDEISDVPYESKVVGYAARNLDTQIDSSNRAGANGIIDEGYLQNQQALNSSVKSFLQTADQDNLDNRVAIAQAALNEGASAPSVGTRFRQENYSFADKSVADAIDVGIAKDDNEADFKTVLGLDPESPIGNFLNEARQEVTEVAGDIVAKFSDLGDELKELKEFIPEGNATRNLIDLVTDPEKLKEAGVLAGLEAQSILFDRLGQEVFPKVGLDKDASIRDVVEFLSFLPEDEEADIDIENAVKIVFSKGSIEERMNNLRQWDTEFTEKYGDKAYYKLAAFMAKEGLVDAATLAMALKNPKIAKTLIADSKDKIYKRMMKALGRASVMGLGGTGVKASMDNYLGLETNLGEEFALRAGGAFVGEGIASVIAKAGRGILGIGNTIVNKGLRLETHSGHIASAADPTVIPKSLRGLQPDSMNNETMVQTATEFPIREQDLEIEDLSTTIIRNTQGDNTKPYRDLAEEAMQAMRRHEQGSLGHIFDMNESEIAASMFAPNRTLKQNIMLHGVGNKIIGETIAKQTEVDNVLNYYFQDGIKTVARRAGRFKGDDSFKGWKKTLAEARNWVGDVADNLFDETVNKDMYQKALIEAEEAAFRGLDKKVTNRMLDIRAEFEELASRDPNFRVTQTMLDMKGLTPSEQDAYWATGKLLDFAAILSETLMVNGARKKGLKQVGGKLYKVLETREDGISVVQGIGKDKRKLEVATGDLSEVNKVLGYKKHFVPRRPDRPDYMIGIMDTTTGKIDVPTASRYKGEVDQKMVELDAELAGTNKIAFYWRSMTDQKSLNFGLANNSMSLIEALDEPTLNIIKQGLANSDQTMLKDVDINNLRLAFDNITYGSVASQKIAGQRGKEGLKTVTGDAFDYKPADEAITQHLLEVSALQLQDFRNEAIKQFEKEFADVLDPMQNWDQPIKTILGKEDLVARAKSIQDFIRINVFNETNHGKAFRTGIDTWATRMRKKGGRSKQMVNSLERMPIIENLFKETRDGTAFFRAASSSLVFAGNVGSFIAQVAPSVAMILGAKGITNPAHLARGWSDMMSALSVRAGNKFASKTVNQNLRAIERSGILSRAEMSDIANAAYGQTSTIFNKAMFFVAQGEKVNRANIWFTIRAEMMDKVAKKQLTSIDGERILTKQDIDSDEFLQIINTKAKQIFLDTTSAGRLHGLSGAGSVLGQFTAPIIKTHTMWFAKGLSPAEKVGASLGLFAMFGINAVPFVAAGFYAADKTAEMLAGADEIEDFALVSDMARNFSLQALDKVQKLAGFSNEDKQFFIDTTKKGLVSTLTGGEVDLYHKMAMGLFLEQTLESAEDPLQAIPVVSILSKAAESSKNIGEMLYQVYEAQTNPDSTDQKVIDLKTFMGDVLNQTGNALPGFGKIVDTLNNHPDTRRLLNPELEDLDNKGWVTRSGKRVVVDQEFTTTDRMLNLFGIIPAPVQENREVLSKQFDRVKILKKMKEEWRDKYMSAGTASARQKIMGRALNEIQEAEKVLYSTYHGALSIASGSSDDRFYRVGSLPKQWMRMFLRVEQERISGNTTFSTGD